jgi:phosphatidylinositol 4-phosphatase
MNQINSSSSFCTVKTTQIPQNMQVYRKVCGILGTIKLIGGHYLIVATHRLFIGLINSQAIWRLAGIEILPYTSAASLNESQVSSKYQV